MKNIYVEKRNLKIFIHISVYKLQERKLSYKERANFTLDARPLRKFRAYCAEHGYAMSKILEQCMVEWLKEAWFRN